MNYNSNLFQTISHALLCQCCQRYLKEDLVSAKLLDGGLFNTTYRLDTPTRSAILRLGPVHQELALPYERHLMEAEYMLQPLLSKHGIPTSQTIALDTSRTFLDRDIMLVQCIPGVSLSTVTVAPETEQRICFEVGELARKIYEITANELPVHYEKPFGRLANVLAGAGGSSWGEAILIEVSLWREQAEKISMFTTAQFDRFVALFQKFRALLDAGCSTPRLVHADLWYGNLLVDPSGNLLALIDGDRALFGDPEFDFATGLLIGQSFFRGYGAQPDPSPAGALRRRLYKLLLNLEDCYVHLGEFNNPHDGHALCQEVLKELQALESI